MARGWKCPRCSTQNGEGVMNCAKCGLIQGGVFVPSAYVPPQAPQAAAAAPTPADESEPWPPAEPAALPPAAQGVGAPLLLGSEEEPGTGWVPPYPAAAPAPRPLWRRIPVGLLLFGLLVVGGAVAGFISNASRSETGDITKSGDMSSNDLRIGDCWNLKDPTADKVDNVTAKPCTESHKYEVFFVGPMDGADYPSDEQFATFVSDNCLPAFTSYVGQTYDNSTLDISWLVPLNDGWSSGDRTVECSVYDPNDSELTASLKSSRR